MEAPAQGEVYSNADQSFLEDCPLEQGCPLEQDCPLEQGCLLTEGCARMCAHAGCCDAECRSTKGARTQGCRSLGSYTKDYHAKCCNLKDSHSECRNTKSFLSECNGTKGICTKYFHTRGSCTKDHHPSHSSTLTKYSVVLTKYHWTIAVLLLLIIPPQTTAQNNSVCLNATSSLTVPNYTWDLTATLAVSFSACSDSGTLLTTSSSTTQELRLALSNSSVVFAWNISGQSGNAVVRYSVNKNSWYMVKMEYIGGDLNLTLLQGTKAVANAVLVANSTFNSFLLNVRLTSNLRVGSAGYIGCVHQGSGLLSTATATPGVIWDYPWSTNPLCPYGAPVDGCYIVPCQNGATCTSSGSNYTCVCPPNFNGTNCQNNLANLYGCMVEPCLNGGTCESPGGNQFKCICAPGYTGVTCDTMIDLCRTAPCRNTGVCTPGINSYHCNCTGTGFTGMNCTDDVNECTNTSLCGEGYRCSNYPGGFQCECPAGFTGVPCKNFNDCRSDSCLNGATCNDGIDTVTCSCVRGYTGPRCEIDIDECASSPCNSPGSRCIDQVASYLCVCKDGYSGNPSNCVDIDECSLNFCKYNSVCNNTAGSYTCTCPLGYSDVNCSTNINDCLSSPCKFNTSCKDGINNYTCECPPGLTGRNCEINNNDCANVTCLNSGTCQDLINGFVCNCRPGFTGRNCETKIDYCNPNPCNQGLCTVVNFSYNCTCLAGFTGANCSTNINDCQPNPCQNGGECFDGTNDYSCNCTWDWAGKNCFQKYNACSLFPCKNGGSCSSIVPSHDYNCTCPLGFQGSNCEIDIDDCKNNSCKTYQRCYDGINTYTCDCPPGFTGSMCESEIDYCANSPCLNGGTCKKDRGNYTCNCTQIYIRDKLLSGYTGVNCEKDIDECEYTNLCQNGGLCRNDPPGHFTCYCKSDASTGNFFTGSYCEQSRSYCDIRLPNQTCQNGGVCRNENQGSVCDCAPGFAGSFCELNIDDCAPKPCQNNGTCKDQVNGYTCTCIPGITGRDCELNIDDCQPKPCLNNGRCLDKLNDYSCDCSNTGFTGARCETNIDDCIGKPCQHGGTCIDGIKQYSCSCFGGYTGANCTTDIQECKTQPCHYNSTCYEFSNETLYDKGDLNFVNFTYEKAAGYLCYCVPGVTGPNCSVDINECDSNPCYNNATCNNKFNSYTCTCAPGYTGVNCIQEINECDVYRPCQNGGACTDKVADYLCTCQKVAYPAASYGGKNCTVPLVGCMKNVCVQGSCIPKLTSDGLHAYDCQCKYGYTGQYCDTPTGVSFTQNSSIVIPVNNQKFDLSLRFRTTLSAATVLVCITSDPNLNIIVELYSGRLQIKYLNNPIKVLDTLAPVNNSDYHTLTITASSNITLTLPADQCKLSLTANQPCVHQMLASHPNIQSIQIGPASGLTSGPGSFVGCMEDISVNKQLYYPGTSGEFNAVSAGCPRTVQCTQNTCHNHGYCQDLWVDFKCYCVRPFYGDTCQEEYQAYTLGKDGANTFVYFNLFFYDDYVSITFFITTRQETGFVLYGTNGAGKGTSKESFLVLYLKQGQLHGDLNRCSVSMQIQPSVAKPVNDGQRHYVESHFRNNTYTLYVDSVLVYAARNIEQKCLSNNMVSLPYITFGLFYRPQNRKRRDVYLYEDSEVLIRTKRQDNSLTNYYLSMPGLEGVIQDVVYNNKPVGYADNLTATNISESTRKVCTNSTCEHGGVCNDVFFNDFVCNCTRGYAGKNCSEPDFCSYATCPDRSHCVNLQLGYECVSTASFLTDNSAVSYSLYGAMPAPVLTFRFRSRALYGLIYLLQLDQYFIKLRLARGRLEMNSKLSEEFSETATTNQQLAVNDGKWYHVRFEVVNSTFLRLQVFQDDSGNRGNIYDDTGNRPINGSFVEMDDMLTKGKITLANSNLAKYSKRWEVNFHGCLEEVRMGGVLMPFFPDSLFINNTAPVRYLATPVDLIHHCTGKDVCSSVRCLNGGTCRDEWNAFHCDCMTGFEGGYCEVNPDDCPTKGCQHGGRCLDGAGTATCDCLRGYSGDRCQTTLDLCSGTTDCQNNGTCVNRGYDTICNCSGTNYTGWYCNVTVNQGCSDNLCLNGGTCTSDLNSSFTCICPRGYEGPLCERLIDYCHKDGYMCAYNGTCTNIPGSYICTCDNSTGYGGVNCTDRVTNCPQGSCSNGQCFYGSNNYTCVCNNGYEGLTCSSVYDVCVNQSSCQRGMCSVSGCNCTGTGFTGPGCDVMVDECKNSTSACKHGGNCTDVEFGFSCNCSLGYRGDTCEIPDCSLTECYNNGTCKTNATEWSCDCPKFVEGGQCESVGPCYYQPCSQTNSNNCTQQIQNNTYQCHCKPGWTGKNCTEDIDECTARELNCVHGQCVNTPGSAYCNCTPGYKDKFCDVDINECQSNPCQHGGTCVDGVNNYTCQCGHSGFDGPNCADDIDECALNASICNHGNCTNEIGNFSCVCDKEYLAPDCLHLDPCFNFTCLNGGTCTINESNMAVCACSGSFQGVTCEKSPSSAKDTDLGVIIGPIIGGIVFVIIVIVVIAFIMTARSKRATRGAYSPSQQETSGSRVELGNVLKKPPEERLI